MRQSLLLRHGGGGCWNLLRLHGSIRRLNVVVARVWLWLGVGDLAVHRGSRVGLRRLLRYNGILRRTPYGRPDRHGHLPRLLNDHGSYHVVVTRLMIMVRAHMLSHGRGGHRVEGASRLTQKLILILHGNLMIGHSLVVLTGHPGTGRHLVRVDGSVHDVGWVLNDRGLRVGCLRRLRRLG